MANNTMTDLQRTRQYVTVDNLRIHEFDAIQALFERNGFTDDKGFNYSRFMDMSGWDYEVGQQGFGIQFRDYDDFVKIEEFANRLPFLTYITDVCAEDDEGEFYDCIYYVDNVAFASHRRKEKIKVALES